MKFTQEADFRYTHFSLASDPPPGGGAAAKQWRSWGAPCRVAGVLPLVQHLLCAFWRFAGPAGDGACGSRHPKQCRGGGGGGTRTQQDRTAFTTHTAQRSSEQTPTGPPTRGSATYSRDAISFCDFMPVNRISHAVLVHPHQVCFPRVRTQPMLMGTHCTFTTRASRYSGGFTFGGQCGVQSWNLSFKFELPVSRPPQIRSLVKSHSSESNTATHTHIISNTH